jgi:ATP-dependent DNA helicase RecQ
MTDQNDALRLLRRSLDNPTADFRNGQWEAIDALVNRRQRLLIVQRTGWGKSSVYFIATRILRDRGLGPTLIISPLLALMRDQIEAAERLGIKAASINSTLSREERRELERAVRDDEYDAVLTSPEQLANDEFVEETLQPIANRIGLLVVDETHCISDWGHDFRPDYRRLINVLQRMPPNMPILGTTATANNRVVDDVQLQLGDIGIQRGSLMRETLALQTLYLPTRAARLAWLAEHVMDLPGTGIIYALTKRDADQVADWLNKKGISVHAYYNGITDDGFANSNAYREYLEGQLLGNRVKALVATSALGMGYDKPDLGFVVHYQAPGSIIAYYQQVGRAGRAIDRAVGVLMSGDEDEEIHEFFRRSAFPREQFVQSILDALDDSDGLKVRELEEVVNLQFSQISQALKFLSVESPAPILKEGSLWKRTQIDYHLDHEHIGRLIAQRESEWEDIQAYVNTDGCLMQFLADALDDENSQPCGKCASCLERPVVGIEFSREVAIDATRFLKHAEMPLNCNKQVARDAFKQYGFKGNLPQDLRAETGRILSRWCDAGWGQMVADDKHQGHFQDELVEAVAEMVRKQLQPVPTLEWVTCVPSRNHPDLVPDFAYRLAERLQLPFEPVVTKIEDNEPQKVQDNRFFQCQNLDGVFEVKEPIPGGPVLLVDDVFDSGWTMTVIAALLRQAGSGPVWPVALASSRAGN